MIQLSELVAELELRLPTKFGLHLTGAHWESEACLEVLEIGLRSILDCIEAVEWQQSYDALLCIHQLLLHPHCSSFDSVLSQFEKGRKMTELMARALLMSTFAISRSYNISINRNDDAIKAFVGHTREIAVCLSTALLPEYLWILDEILSLLSYAEMSKSTHHFYSCDLFCKDFYTELQVCYIEYVDEFVRGSCKMVGKNTVYSISKWTHKKREFVRSAERAGTYNSAALKRFALLNKSKSVEFMREQQRLQVKTSPSAVGGCDGLRSSNPPLSTSSTASLSSTATLPPPTKKRSRAAIELDFNC